MHCTEIIQRGSLDEKKIIAVANENVPTIEVEHPFLLHCRINNTFSSLDT
jgi:hypothetical protein